MWVESFVLGDNPISFNWEGFPGRFDLSPLILRLKGLGRVTLPTCLANARVWMVAVFGRGRG